jgi:uncharacterized protein DUF3592
MSSLMNASFGLGAGIALLVAIPFVLIALYFLYGWYRDRRRAQSTLSWTPTTGRIMYANVESHQSYSSSSHTHTTVYSPQVAYEYMVNGMRYQSNQIAVGAGYSTSIYSMMEAKVARYPVGAPVQVFYNPANPQEAVLEHGTAGGNLYLFLAIFIIVLVGSILACTIIPMVFGGQWFGQFMNTIMGFAKR